MSKFGCERRWPDVGRPRGSADLAQLPTASSFCPGVDTSSPWSLARGIGSAKSVWLLHVGPWILALASDWSRWNCFGSMMCHCSWAASPSHVQLPSGPFWPLGLLVLAQEFMPWIICSLPVVLSQIHLHTFSDQHLWNLSNNHLMLTFIPFDDRLLHDS